MFCWDRLGRWWDKKGGIGCGGKSFRNIGFVSFIFYEGGWMGG